MWKWKCEMLTGFVHEMICPVRSPCAGGGGGGGFFAGPAPGLAFGFGVGLGFATEFGVGFTGGFVGALDGVTRLRKADAAVIDRSCAA